MTNSTDGSNESANSENASTGNLKHSPSIIPDSTARPTYSLRSLTKKVLVVIALIIAAKTGAIMAFGDNAYITALLELLLQSLEGTLNN